MPDSDEEVTLTVRRRSKFMGDMEDVQLTGRMSSVEELNAWLDEDMNTRKDGSKRKYDVSAYPRAWDVDAARNGTLRFMMQEGPWDIQVAERWQGVEFVVRGRIVDLEIVRIDCEHDWTEWRYDTMGGDNRDCRRCGRTEFI